MASMTVTKSGSILGLTVTGARGYNGDQPIIINGENLSPATVNRQFMIGIDESQLQAIVMRCTADAEVRVNNPAAAPIVLVANRELIWETGDPPIPPATTTAFDGDVTSLYVSCVDGGVFSVVGLVNNV